jgi:hypothetical protein
VVGKPQSVQSCMYRSVSLSSNVMYRLEREARYEDQKLKFGSLPCCGVKAPQLRLPLSPTCTSTACSLR